MATSDDMNRHAEKVATEYEAHLEQAEDSRTDVRERISAAARACGRCRAPTDATPRRPAAAPGRPTAGDARPGGERRRREHQPQQRKESFGGRRGFLPLGIGNDFARARGIPNQRTRRCSSARAEHEKPYPDDRWPDVFAIEDVPPPRMFGPGLFLLPGATRTAPRVRALNVERIRVTRRRSSWPGARRRARGAASR
jgi:hypothetical protein